MKKELEIILLSFLTVIILSFFIFNIQNIYTTGFAVEEGLSNKTEIISEGNALDLINSSQRIIEEMKEYNFSVNYMNDELLEAKRVFEMAKYADVLRENNASPSEISEARRALQLIDWKKITYADVLIHTNNIENRSQKAFIIFDSITAAEIRINNYREEKVDVGEAEKLLEEARISFNEERYEDSEILLEKITENLELKKTETATLNVLKTGTKNFIQRYWIYMLIFVSLFSILGFFLYKKITENLLKKKIDKMNIERDILTDLIKKIQLQRYKDKTISSSVYNIKMEKYQKRLNEIKEVLPVLESQLNPIERATVIKKEVNPLSQS